MDLSIFCSCYFFFYFQPLVRSTTYTHLLTLKILKEQSQKMHQWTLKQLPVCFVTQTVSGYSLNELGNYSITASLKQYIRLLPIKRVGTIRGVGEYSVLEAFNHICELDELECSHYLKQVLFYWLAVRSGNPKLVNTLCFFFYKNV